MNFNFFFCSINALLWDRAHSSMFLAIVYDSKRSLKNLNRDDNKRTVKSRYSRHLRLDLL